MVGPSGSGKSTYAAKHFQPNEIVSSDNIRAELLGDFRIQSNQHDVWEEVHRRVRQRLSFGQRVVVDATNIKFGDRKPFVEMAKHFGIELIYLIINRTIEAKIKTGGWRNEVDGLIEKHDETFMNNLKEINRGDNNAARVIKIWNDTELKIVNNPIDSENALVNFTINKTNQFVTTNVVVVGDVHGNVNELDEIISNATKNNSHILFLGDIIDYGHFNLVVFDTVYQLIKTGRAHMVWGNHERKLDRWINSDFGRNFKGVVGIGLQMTIAEINDAIAKQHVFKDRFLAKWRFMAFSCRQHFIIDNYLFTHGAATPEMWSMKNRHSLYGEHQNLAFFGEVDKNLPSRQDGMPNRIYEWVNKIPAGKTVVVGHDPRSKTEPLIVTNNDGGKAIFLDTGSSKGGVLSTITINDFNVS
jgi:protein phosphatase